MDIVTLDFKKEKIMTNLDKMLPMNLQLFADEAVETTEATETTETTQEETAEETKSYTQAELNALFTERAKRAKQDTLKELGIGDVDRFKEQLTAFNEHKESLKTEQEKQAEVLALKEQEYAELQAEKQQLTTKLAMLTKGVNNEALDDVAVLAERLVSDDVTIEQAIDQVLEKYPQFGVQTAEDKPSIVKDGNMKTVDTNTKDPFAAKLAKWNK